MGERKKYDKAFKVETVRLITEHERTVSSVAYEIGVHENTIYKWLKDFKADPEQAFPGCGNLRPDDDEMRRIKRRNAELEEEVTILKKAMAIFTRPPR
jgi:transposase